MRHLVKEWHKSEDDFSPYKLNDTVECIIYPKVFKRVNFSFIECYK